MNSNVYDTISRIALSQVIYHWMNTNQLHRLQYLFPQINIRNLLFIYFLNVGPISGFHMNVPFLMLIACSET